MRELPPHENLQQITGPHILSRCLQTVAYWGVADHIGDQPARAEALAKAAGCDAGALARVLSLLQISRESLLAAGTREIAAILAIEAIADWLILLSFGALFPRKR